MPVDPDALAEAVEYLTVGQGSANLSMAGIKKPDWDALAVSVSANRALLEAPTAQYCKRHGSWGPEGTCEAKVRNNFDSACEVVGRVRLVAEEEK